MSGPDRLRRHLLRAGGALLALRGAVARGSTPRTVRPLDPPEPIAQIALAAAGMLLAVSTRGTLWSLADGSVQWSRIADGLDAQTPVAQGHGRLVARTEQGGLWVRERDRASVTPDVSLAQHAGLLVLPLGVIGVAAAASGARVVRLEPSGRTWIETARSAEAVLPDARPLQVDLDASGGAADGHIAVLAGPDSARYAHAVLGDAVEATRVLYLERHGLEALRTLTVPAPYVLEDIAPRPLRWHGRNALLTMQSGAQGAALAVVAADRRDRAALVIAALGTPIGTRNRWMAATTDGVRLLAVHTPHIGGVLHEYRPQGATLAAWAVASDVCTHAIGSRETDLAAWADDLLVVPNQQRTVLRFLDPAADWRERAALALPAPVAAARCHRRDGRDGVAVRLGDGSVWFAG